MGRAPYPASVRRAAVETYFGAGKDLSAAVSMFYDQLGEAQECPQNPWQFIPYWVDHWKEHSSVLSAPHRGQPPFMPDSEADECLRLLRSGYRKTGGAHRPFRSVRQAMRKSAALAALAAKHGYKHGSLLRRLKARDPHLHRSTLRYRRLLSNTIKRQRVTYCQNLLDMGLPELRRYLARVVWVDAKKLYVCPKSHLVYAPSGAGRRSTLLVADARLSGNQFDTRKIHYYAAVNQVLGACHFKVCSGTSDYKQLVKEYGGDLKLYKVGAGGWAPASNSYEPVKNTKLQWGFAFTAATARCAALPHCLSSW